MGCAAPETGSRPLPVEPVLGVHYAPIINGTEESGRDHVVLLINRENGGLCTGALVADRVVLTAKHCIQEAGADGPIEPSQTSVGIGTRAFGGDMRWFSVAAIATTPGVYTDGALGVQDLVGSDVAVVTLVTSPGIAVLGMKLTAPDDEVGKRATAVGFGQTPGGDVGVKYTVETTVGRVASETIEVDGTVCQGDSGGPIINEKGETFGVVSFGTSMGCGGGASFYQRIDIWADLIRQAIEKSGDCSNDGPEACDGFDNDCDKKVDEDCAALGEGCSDDADCLTRLCVPSANGKVCASMCDPLSPDSGCDKGYFCSSTDGCKGVCLPGKIGEKAFGEECADDTECASLFCVDPGDKLRRCLVACRGGESNCLSGEACVAANGQCGSCVEADLVSSALGQDEPCGSDKGCRSGKCFDDGGTQYCALSCKADDDCDEKHHCRDETCVRGTRQGLGGACEEHGDCDKGFFCAKTEQGDFCTRECGASEPCGDGFTCNKASNGMVCLPDDSVLAGPCEADGDCASGRCHLPSGTCTKRCTDATACGAGLECERAGDASGLCLTPEAAAADPSLGEGIVAVDGGMAQAPAKKGDGGCAVSTGSRSQLGSVFALAALARGLSRRRRRAA